MKINKDKNFERELPSGYKQSLHINAKDAKFGIIFNLISLLVLAVVVAVAIFSLSFKGYTFGEVFSLDLPNLLITYLVFFLSIFSYIILHELVHGVAYKSLTGEKLTFGLSWSCAFCGVPNIFTYRKTAIIAIVAPFAVFTILLIPTIIALYFVSPLYYLIFAFVFGLHFGGCSGDLYLLILLLIKYKDNTTLMRDTGPEQFIYVKSKDF